MRKQLLALLFGIVALGIALPAGATERIRCEVLSIEASTAGRGVDPALSAALGRHAGVLSKPPFAGFDSFRLESRRPYELEVGKAVDLTLPRPFGGRLTAPGRDGARFELILDIVRPGASPVRIQGKASPGTPLFAAGFAGPGGTWIFGVICDLIATAGIIQH